MEWYWWVAIGVGVLIVLNMFGSQENAGGNNSVGYGNSPSSGPMIIGIGSARRSPTLTPALESYVAKLVGIYHQHGGLQNAAARSVGEEIHRAHGHQAMVDVCDTVRNRVGDTGYRQLEYCWHGIGVWQA
jgi:hypothetical protein